MNRYSSANRHSALQALKFAIGAAVVASLSAYSPAIACDKDAYSKQKEISLRGTLTKVEKQILDKHGDIKTVESFRLTDGDASTDLPVRKNCKGEPDVDLTAYVGRTVTVRARGIQKTRGNGQPLVYVEKVLDVRGGDDAIASPSNALGVVRSLSPYDLIRLHGRLSYEQRQSLDRSGMVQTSPRYVLVTADNEIELPARVAVAAQSQLRPLIGDRVTIGVRGLQKEGNHGELLMYVHELVSVDRSRSDYQADPFGEGI